MRIRKSLALVVLALGLVAFAAPAAYAVDPGVEHGHHLVECVEEALHDNEPAVAREDFSGFENDLEDCHKSKSLFVAALPELLWGGIAFAVVFLALCKFAFPALKKGLAAREEKIRGDLEGAERARTDAERELADYRAKLADAQSEANRIVEESRVAAEQVRRDLIARAEADAAEVRARGAEDVRLAVARAQGDLQNRVKELSIELAEKVVERNLDADTQRALIDSYIDRVGSN